MNGQGWIDISMPLRVGMRQWPGDPLYCFNRAVVGGVSVTTVRLCAHTGTHVDAPLHYLEGGVSVERLPLETLIGEALVCEIGSIEAAPRVLIRASAEREELTLEETSQLVNAGCRLVGIGSLSVGGDDVHRLLLQAGVTIVEGLQLERIEPGWYDWICLPILLVGADGAPARAVIRRRAGSYANSPSE